MSCNNKINSNHLQNNLEISYPNKYISDEINKLKKNISNIYYNKSDLFSYQDLYMTVENLCTLNQSENILNDLHIINTEFLNIQLIDLQHYNGIIFLKKLKELWLMYCHKYKTIKNIYLFMEATILKKEKRKLSISQLCMEQFYEIILLHAVIKKKLDFIYSLIDEERNGAVIDQKLINAMILMLDKLSLYDTYFEQNFLLKTQEYYIKKRDLLIDDKIIEYFYFVDKKMNQERKLIESYLKASTLNKITKLLYKILIEEKLDVLMNKLESANIFQEVDTYYIRTVYDLLVTLPKADNDLCKIFSNFMVNVGTKYIFDMQNEANLIQHLIDFKDSMDDIVELCFRNNPTYTETVRSCFKKFINQRKKKPAQFLAKFIDNRMRDKQIPEDLLDKIMVIFRFIQGKDVFEAYYKRYLSKRLLLGKSSSQDAEKYMISKLKLECGDGFTSKLEGMFRDIDSSLTLTSTFKQRNSENKLAIEFTAHILTSSFWPTFTKYAITLSDNLNYYQNIYHDFYRSKYSGRSLQWISSLGYCLLRAGFKGGNKEFQVSLFQAVVLLLFNEDTAITYKNMKLHLNLNERELKRTLFSLISGKTKILLKNACPHNINDDDEFNVNSDYTNKFYRIKINELQYKETEEEQKITENEVLHDRQLQIDAAVVRILKQKQIMSHNTLMNMLYDVLKFPVNQSEIKKRIEILIERDFIARNPEDRDSYLYVA